MASQGSVGLLRPATGHVRTAGLLAGAATIVVGSALPWFSTVAGLNVVHGTATPYGKVLIGLAFAVVLAAAAEAWRPGVLTGRLTLTTAVISAAAATSLLAAYLVLLRTFASDPFAFGGGGPGVPVAAAGAGVVTVTVLARRTAAATGDEVAARVPAAFAVPATLAGAGLIHLAVMPEHFGEWWAYGLFFAVSAAGQLGAAAWFVLGRPGRAVRAAGAVLSVLIVALWLLTRTAGLPFGPDAGEPESWGIADAVCAGLEVLSAVVLLAPAVARRRATDVTASIVVAALTAWAVLDATGVLSAGTVHVH